MPHILGDGSASDPCALRLDTRKRRHINNVPGKQYTREVMQAKVEAVLCKFPDIRLVSASSVYNCYGLAFASRRTRILDSNEVLRILEDDDFRSLPPDNPAVWERGDIVLYRIPDDGSREIRHVAIISDKRPRLESGEYEVWVISAWSDLGEYYHRVEEVPPTFGEVSEVVSQRVILR